ncbi:MAG: YncE family protein [Bacteroidales bacterium]|nr:YncE family protein [Bacteroidales bacterium]MDE7072908.1 YncE family protein [Bacteroidales bacterium]
MKKRFLSAFLLAPLCAAVFFSCEEEKTIVPSEYENLPIPARQESSFASGEPIGMYLLNEGNMGSNKSTIDYADFVSGRYIRNFYTEKNPAVMLSLGDMGNDIQIYGSKLYAVVNGSHKVEVMNARSCVRIGQIEIPNGRYIRFANGKAYVSAYVGGTSSEAGEQLGTVYEIDTALLTVTRKVTVGYQPEELEIAGNYLYVANSGQNPYPDYEYTVSIVETDGMTQVKKLPVGINLHRLRQDRYGRLWVTSRGNYYDVPSNLYVLTPGQNPLETTIDTLDIPCSEFAIKGDSLYFYSLEWKDGSNSISYGVIDINTKTKVCAEFISDGTQSEIQAPYGIAVNPYNGDIFIADAKNYVSSGMLHCYSSNGTRKWSVRTGDIPGHMAFLCKE